MVLVRLKGAAITGFILLATVFTVATASSAEENKFNGTLIEVEGVLTDILKDLRDKGVWIGIGQSNGQDRMGLGSSGLSNDNLPTLGEERQLFEEPYIATIAASQAQAAKAQGYCVGRFDTAKMHFDPKPIDSAGEAYVLLSCGPFSKFNCSKKCKISVRAGRWGESSSSYGKEIYFPYDKKGGKKSLLNSKKELQNSILEASESLLDGESITILK